MKRLIDADAAIDHWRHIVDATNTDGRYNTGFVDGLEFCISHLSTMPSAQPERKTGHWIFCDTSCKCSICGEDPMIFVETTGFNSALMDREYPMRFCPNCGAKMEVEHEA